jgi:hypothetical protein
MTLPILQSTFTNQAQVGAIFSSPQLQSAVQSVMAQTPTASQVSAGNYIFNLPAFNANSVTNAQISQSVTNTTPLIVNPSQSLMNAVQSVMTQIPTQSQVNAGINAGIFNGSVFNANQVTTQQLTQTVKNLIPQTPINNPLPSPLPSVGDLITDLGNLLGTGIGDFTSGTASGVASGVAQSLLSNPVILIIGALALVFILKK